MKNKLITMSDYGINSKIEEITKQIELVNTIPGNIIDFTTATQITKNLIDLRCEYMQERDRRKSAGIIKKWGYIRIV